ncbi:MAG: hypothetical protein Q4C12_00020 [Clostridia bacterium]|nr:hypothetical protein [Clostridia bacterium]
MRCNEINYGTYDCAYNIMPPFKTGTFPEFRYVAIDKCLLKEVIDLWEQGIKTTGCCCGHGNKDMAFIGARFEDIDKMKSLGYKVHFNKCRPDDEDSFIPKTILDYREIYKGFNWWTENK